MQLGLKGKIAIVTGAAQGIGEAVAKALIDEGATVVVADVQIETGKATAERLGQAASFIPCDITDVGQVRGLIDATVERFGHLDIMVNNAGINTTSPEERVTIDKYPDETWHKVINVDLNGTFYCCKAAAQQMVKQKSGSIINIASVGGVVALRLQVGFCAAKAGVLKMTEAMACELAPYGIRVNAVSPGSTLTQGTRELFYGEDGSFKEKAEKLLSFIPQHRPGEVEEIAGAVVYLASDAGAYVNGHNIVVDGGWTCGFNRDF